MNVFGARATTWGSYLVLNNGSLSKTGLIGSVMPKQTITIPFEELPYYLQQKNIKSDIAKVTRLSRTEYKVYFKCGGGDRWYYEDDKWWVEYFI